MPFYKRENNELLSTTHLDGPGFTLSENSKDEYTYPVDGWYWFADLDTAMQGMQTTTVGTITVRQAKLALLQAGLLDAMDAAVASFSPEAQIEWEYGGVVHRDNPYVLGVTAALGITNDQLDALFALASTL